MKKIEWTGKFETGISKVDSEHRSLVELINAIESARTSSEDCEPAIESAIDKLLDYTVSHFQHEEELMKNAGYSDFEAHKEEHERLRTFALGLLGRYHRGEAVLSELLNTLNHWLVSHIMGEDKKYVTEVKKYLQAN